jgi:protein-disulfide isomerase
MNVFSHASRLGVSLICLFAMASTASAQQASPPPDTAAVVGPERISQAELDKAVGHRLLTLKTQEYAIKRSILEELIQERLLIAEAKRLGMTKEALEQTEITAKAQPVTDEEVRVVYDSAKDRMGGLPEAEARKRIAESMARRRVELRREAYVKELSAKSGVRVLRPAPRVEIDPGAGAPSRGPATAPVTIVEFSDYQCPYCARAYGTLNQVRAKYPTQVRIVFRDFPLPIHREAPKAAEAAHCAGDQSKFWEMHDVLFENPSDLTEPALLKHARTLKLDEAAFSQCLSSGKHAGKWQKDLEVGREYGVSGTPAFFINGRFVNGALPLEAFVEIIEEELQQAKPAGPSASR